MSSSSNNSQITTFIKESKDLFIPFQVIEKATNDFTTVLGKGGYGVVYKGELLLLGQLTSVAIKRLDSNISGQGIKEFLTEIQLLSRYKHPNIVSLLGFCDEAGERILIYEYAEHGSLDKYLNAPKTTIQLTWEQRISICLDMARGLDYLHNRVATNHRVIHRDIKSANILIGHEWKAMITDLGLSKIGRANEGDSYVITNASGTHGYCDPTYIQTGVLTKGSDIFSFGVVMFEVLCGRLAVTKVDNKYQYLAEIAQRYYEGKRLYEIIDPYLMKEVDFASLKRFSDIAYKCLHKERVLRPSMDLVVQQLELCQKKIRREPAILSRFKQFSAMNILKRVALLVIVESLPEDEIADLREIFKSIDTDNSGVITFDELTAGLRKYGSILKDKKIKDLMDAADLDNSGTIDYAEFVAATVHLNKLENEDHLVAAFQYFDKDGSGYITVDELQQAFADHNITNFPVEDIIREVDQDNDGRIGYGEFVAMMRKGNVGFRRKTMQNS